MAIPQEPQETFDPFARAIPGQSLTDTPKARPYENPPTAVNPEDVLENLESSLKEEEAADGIGDLLEVGVSCEAISECLMQKCFTEGMCSPDVSELVKPGIFLIVAQIGYDQNVDDMVLFNKDTSSTRLTDERKLDLMEKLSPAKFKKIIEEDSFDIFSEEDTEEDLMEEGESENDEDIGLSFMDMEEPLQEEQDFDSTEEEDIEEMEIA